MLVMVGLKDVRKCKKKMEFLLEKDIYYILVIVRLFNYV